MPKLRIPLRRRLAVLPLEDRITPALGDLLHTLNAPAGGALAGTAVAATNQYVVVGAPGFTISTGKAGVYDSSSGSLLWTLTSPSASNGDRFGYSVAIAGNLVVVGAPGDDTSGADTGRAFVYDLSSGSPTTPSAILVNPDPFPSPATQGQPDLFGNAVAISGTTAWVGSSGDSHTLTYGGRVLKFDATTGANIAAGAIDGPAEAQNRGFGDALAVSGNLLAVAAKLSGSNFEGKVYVYNTASASPALQTTIDEPAPQGFNNQDWFGLAIAMEGTKLVVGAPRQNLGGFTQVGAAYVFDVPVGGGNATLQATINNPHPHNTTSPYTGEWFGHGVGIANGTVVVGSPYDDTNVQGGGQAYLFNASNGSFLANVRNPHTSTATSFGWSAAAAGDKLIVGADDTNEAYTFQGVAPSGPPSVTINQRGTADPTNATSIPFDVVFSSAVTGFTGSDVVFTGSSAPGVFQATVSGSGSAYTVNVTGMTGPGTVMPSIPAGVAVDSNSNGNLASTSTDNSVTFDNVKPDVSISQGSSQADPTPTSPITFDVHFTEPVTGFTGSDVSFAGSTDAAHLSASVSPASGQDYTVTVSVLNGSAVPNTVVVSIPAGAAADAAGNGNNASSSSDNSVTYGQIGQLQFGAATYEIDENKVSLQIPVKRVGGNATSISVDYTTADGSAHAGTDYTLTVGSFTWASGDAADKYITIPIADGGVPQADKTFQVNLSNFLPASTAGSQSTTTVTIGGRSELGFSMASYPLAEEGDTVTITVKRLAGSYGPATVKYAVTAGTATAGSDFGAPSGTGTLSWLDGVTADKTFTIPINVDAFSEGRETINLSLIGVTDNAALGTMATSVLTIAPSNGKAGGNPSVDVDGDIVTPKLTGPGALIYYLTNDQAPISEIDLFGTDASLSSVSLTVKKPKGGVSDGRVGIGEFNGVRAKNLALAKVDLTGAGITMTGYVGTLTVGAVKNGADIHLNTTAEALPKLTSATKITAGVIGDETDISVAGNPLASLTATAIGNGTITAPSVGSITVKGKPKTKTAQAIPGDFKSDLTVTGTGVTKGPALRSLRVAGAVANATIIVGSGPGTVGDVGSVSVGSFLDSDLLAGYEGATNGSGKFNNGTLGSFTVKGTDKAFARSNVLAANIKTVVLASVDENNNNTKFGFIYHFFLKSLTAKSPVIKFNPQDPTEQDFGADFYVKKM
jgi:Calx-beta domain/FG-GAP repeat